MTTTTKIRRVPKTAEQLRDMRDNYACVLIERTRHTLVEGEPVVILSSDVPTVGFVGFVYGFEKLTSGNLLAMIELD